MKKRNNNGKLTLMKKHAASFKTRTRLVLAAIMVIFAFVAGSAIFGDSDHATEKTGVTTAIIGLMAMRDPGSEGGNGESAESKLLAKVTLEVKGLLAKEGEASKLELKKVSDLLKELEEKAKANDNTLIKEEVVRLSAELKAMKENGKPAQSLSFKGQIAKFIEDNAAKIKELKAAGSGVLEFKVVASMATTSASNPDGIPELQGVQAAAPTNVNLKTSIVDGLVTKMGTSLASYPYTESVPKDGDYAFVAEKGSKPQVDFKIETRYASPKKVAAYMLLSDESVNDIPGLQSIAYDYLRKKHDLKKQNGILFGDGEGANLKGATEYGRVFSAGGMANKVVAPNFMDVVNATITDIFTTHNYTDEMPFMANLVMINPIDFYTELVAAKDGFGHPLYPMASLFNRVTIGGAVIVPFEDIPEGKIFTADLSKYNTTDFVEYTVKIGWINDNFITNQFCILGESRLHGFVKKLDEQAFIYDDIATVKAAITLV